MEIDKEKLAFNARAKASMQQYLRSKSWEEKVRSIERMNEADGRMKQAMREALAKEAAAKNEKPQPQHSDPDRHEKS